MKQDKSNIMYPLALLNKVLRLVNLAKPSPSAPVSPNVEIHVHVCTIYVQIFKGLKFHVFNEICSKVNIRVS